MSLQGNTVLSVAPDVDVRLRDDGAAEISFAGQRLVCRDNVLALLAVFRTPANVATALDRLGATAAGAADWIELAETMRRLVGMGALRDPTAARDVHVERPHSFERPLSANMRETAPRSKFSVEGEQVIAREFIELSPSSPSGTRSHRSRGEGQAASIHRGVQAQDPA